MKTNTLTEKEINFYKFLINFGVQAVITVFMLGLCSYKLLQPKLKTGEQAIYWGGITYVFGYWMPNSLTGTGERKNQTEYNTSQTNVLVDNTTKTDEPK